ncbi:hypothetical protein ACTA71_004989 [Dictyostelium dimigraforme]
MEKDFEPPQYIKKLEYLHIYEVIQNEFEELRSKYKYTKDNIQTYAVTLHPHFCIWMCALQLLDVGDEMMKENAIEEIFGSDKEGNHSLLVRSAFIKLGPYKIEHYERCQSSISKVYSFLKKETINVIFAFLICCEFSQYLLIDLMKVMEEDFGIKDLLYCRVHIHIDNHVDGHGVKMLKSIENGDIKMSIQELNTGIHLYKSFFSSIFDN